MNEYSDMRLLLLVILTSIVNCESETCFHDKPQTKLKYFYPESEGYNITVERGSRLESQLLAEIFKIVVEEKLNYQVQFTNPDDGDGGPMFPPSIDTPPRAMISLDKMLPISQSVDSIPLMEIGQLEPAIRSSNCQWTCDTQLKCFSFGWFISKEIVASSDYKKSHWTSLKDEKLAENFWQPKENMEVLLTMVDKRITVKRFHKYLK